MGCAELKNKLLRVPLVSLVTGLILSAIEHNVVLRMVKDSTEWTLKMGDTVYYFSLVLCVVLFIAAGLFCFKDMTKKEIAKSASLVVLYQIIVLVAEQLFQMFASYSITFMYLFVPVSLYTTLYQMLLKNLPLSSFILIIPSMFTPYLFILFGNKDVEKLKTEMKSTDTAQ